MPSQSPPPRSPQISRKWEMNQGRWVTPTNELSPPNLQAASKCLTETENVTEITIVNVEVNDSCSQDAADVARALYPGSYSTSVGSCPPSPPKWPSVPQP